MISMNDLVTVVAHLADAVDQLASKTVKLDDCCSERRCDLCSVAYGHAVECPIGLALAMLAPDPS